MIRRTRRFVVAGFTATCCGCACSPPLAPPPVVDPIAMQVAPGLGCSLQSAEAVYLVVNAVDAKNNAVLPQVAEIVAGELRAATPAEVILVVDTGFNCPPDIGWHDLCRVCNVPGEGVSNSAVVVFCDILEYDAYTPLRVSLSMRVRRATDGVQLAALQGTWLGTPPFTPRPSPFHWLMKRGPVRPNIDYVWTAQFEAQSATNVVRHAAHQCVATLATSTGVPASGQYPVPAPLVEDVMPPPAPPALPEILPPPEPDSGLEATTAPFADPPINGSATSVPAESHPSP